MIQPADLHRYFKVREIATGRELRLTGARDTRYELTGTGPGEYRASPEGNYFLVESTVHTHPWHRAVRLDEVEPLPGDAGMYAEREELQLAATYVGSWRQYAASASVRPRVTSA